MTSFPQSGGAVQPDLPLAVPAWLPPVEPTGDPRVDAALDRLAELEGSPVVEHVEIFSDIHVRLTGALADLGDEVPDAASDDLR
ncbi:MAG: hypothetical protein FJW80_09255 [Actinobacteria bacterium]|nr:hypothetical protein [Actinomycetota bacterium]